MTLAGKSGGPVQNLLTRQTTEGNPPGGWIPQMRITLPEAIEGYTLSGAIAGRREKSEGSLEVGKLDDLIIVSQDLFHIEPSKPSFGLRLATVIAPAESPTIQHSAARAAAGCCYSDRSASTGDTPAALLAGIIAATNAHTASALAATASATGSQNARP